MLDAARTLASSFEGATIYVTSDNGPGANFHAAVYSSWPGARQPQRPSTIPAIDSKSAIAETTTLQAPAFAIIIHGNGVIGTRRNFRFGETPSGSELACPPSASFVFSFTVNGHSMQRNLPCQVNLSTKGTVALENPPPAATAPPAAAVNCSGVATNCVPPQSKPPRAQTCPAGSTLYNDTCRSPLALQPAQLFFHFPGDSSPEAFNSNGSDLNYLSAGGKVYINEPFFKGTYSIEGIQCNGIAQPNSQQSLDYGSGASFNIISISQINSVGRCQISVLDDGQSSAELLINQAGSIYVLDDLLQTAIVAPINIKYDPISQSYETVTIDAAKQLFSPYAISAAIQYNSCTNGSPSSSYIVASTNGRSRINGTTSESGINITGLQGTTTNLQAFTCRLVIRDQYPESAFLDVSVDPKPLTIRELQLECDTLFNSYRTSIGGSFPPNNYGIFGRQSNGVGNPYGAVYVLGTGSGGLSTEVLVDGLGVFSAHRDDYFAFQTQHLVYAHQSVNGARDTLAFLYQESTDLLLVAPWSPTNDSPNSAGTSCVVKDTVSGWR